MHKKGQKHAKHTKAHKEYWEIYYLITSLHSHQIYQTESSFIKEHLVLENLHYVYLSSLNSVKRKDKYIQIDALGAKKSTLLSLYLHRILPIQRQVHKRRCTWCWKVYTALLLDCANEKRVTPKMYTGTWYTGKSKLYFHQYENDGQAYTQKGTFGATLLLPIVSEQCQEER